MVDRRGCPVCGLQLTSTASWRCPNRWCARPDRCFSVVFSTGSYEGALRRAIARYKYRDERWWAGVFAGMLAERLDRNPTWFEEFDLLAPVPARGGVGARRRWDPVGEIVRCLEPLVRPQWEVLTGAVVKRRETPAMQGQDWATRQVIAAGPLRRALHVPDRAAVAGSRILLIDDVMTEGSTLREVSRALLAAGALEVAGLVVARSAWTEWCPVAGAVGR